MAEEALNIPGQMDLMALLESEKSVEFKPVDILALKIQGENLISDNHWTLLDSDFKGPINRSQDGRWVVCYREHLVDYIKNMEAAILRLTS